MSNENKKNSNFWLYPETKKLIETMHKSSGCSSQSEYVEKAVQFYSGYLSHEKDMNYLPQILVSTFRGLLDTYEDRQSTLLFKLAVEVNMLQHIVASTYEYDDLVLSRLRAKCVQEVKSSRGVITYE